MARSNSGFLGFSKTDTDRMLLLREATDIRDDVETEVMNRSLGKGYLVRKQTMRRHQSGMSFTSEGPDGGKIISVIGVNRTFDFEIGVAEYGQLYHALQVLLNFHRAQKMKALEAED